MILCYKEFKKYLTTLKTKPNLLLHACCGPCSTHTIKVLEPYFNLTVYYDNSNIDTEEEYLKRYDELKKVLEHFPTVKLVKANYLPKTYYEAVKGLEHLGEFSARCNNCMRLRMENSCRYALLNHFDFFTTTLSISPYKNSKEINNIGYELAAKYHIDYLFSDFKKEGGYQDSIAMSKEFNLYRQHYCGCVFSRHELEVKLNENNH